MAWLAMLFLVRPYVIFIISIANRLDRMSVLETFYGDPAMNFLGALAGITAIIVVLAWIKRHPEAKPITRHIWSRGKNLLILSGVLNIFIIFLPVLTGALSHVKTVGWIEAIICILIIIYFARSDRVKDTFADFPEPSGSD